MVHAGLGKIDLQAAAQIRRQTTARRVATNLVYGGPGRQERGRAIDERRLCVPLIFLGSQRTSDVRDHTPEFGGLDGLHSGNIRAAAESKEIDIVDRDSLSMGQELPERAASSRVRVSAWRVRGGQRSIAGVPRCRH